LSPSASSTSQLAPSEEFDPAEQTVALVAFGDLDEAEPDGPQPPMAPLARGLVQAGYRPVLFTRYCAGEAEPDDDLEVVRIPAGPPEPLVPADLPQHLGEFADGLADALRERDPHVLHSHGWLGGVAGLLATASRRRPLVHSGHRVRLMETDHGGQRPRPDRLRLERAAARRADRVVAYSAVERERLTKLGVPVSRISVVPIGVDLAGLRPEGEREPRPSAHRLLLFASLPQAVPVLRALTALPETELMIVEDERCAAWDERDRQRLAELTDRLGVHERARVVPRPGLAAWGRLLRSADAAICIDGGGRARSAPVEAMACGVPVVAGNEEAAEAVVDGITGVHAVGASARDLAIALRALLTNRTVAEAMAVAGRDRAATRYSWNRVAAELTRVYRELVAPAGSMGRTQLGASGSIR
jgi:glycosyltransferase involved in cell wall biosynthesis